MTKKLAQREAPPPSLADLEKRRQRARERSARAGDEWERKRRAGVEAYRATHTRRAPPAGPLPKDHVLALARAELEWRVGRAFSDDEIKRWRWYVDPDNADRALAQLTADEFPTDAAKALAALPDPKQKPARGERKKTSRSLLVEEWERNRDDGPFLIGHPSREGDLALLALLLIPDEGKRSGTWADVLRAERQALDKTIGRHGIEQLLKGLAALAAAHK